MHGSTISSYIDAVWNNTRGMYNSKNGVSCNKAILYSSALLIVVSNVVIHAGSRGVVVESLEGSYWQQFWLAGGSCAIKNK